MKKILTVRNYTFMREFTGRNDIFMREHSKKNNRLKYFTCYLVKRNSVNHMVFF